SRSSVELRIGQEADEVALADRLLRGIVDEPVGPGGGGEHRRILRRIEVEPALRVPFYAKELAPRVGMRPVEVGARLERVRLGLRRALALAQERPHENEEGDEARYRIAGKADEERGLGAGAHLAESKRTPRLHGDLPHEEPPFGLDRR